ncbi:MAG: hypothetical protein PHT40_04575 [Patescibacteria group bacterium]|nr:hypothetical protein [Patescibacteria group bacterium]
MDQWHNFTDSPAPYPLVIQVINPETLALYLCDECLSKHYFFNYMGKSGLFIFIRCVKCLKKHRLIFEDYQWRAEPPKTPTKEA